MTAAATASKAVFAGENPARQAISDACDRLKLDRDAVLQQFDRWDYSQANLDEIASWPARDPSFLDNHCRLLAEEVADGFIP